MAVSIKVNGSNLSLVHKGSGGIVSSTLPDVCKTPMPGGPVPIPYMIVSKSGDLVKGTKTIKVDGGNPAAIKGSELKCCTGDEPGSAGGVKSGTQLKETSWLSYSFDVNMEGKNACRLTDKLLMNHGNTACLAGIVQATVLAEHPESAKELEKLCTIMCEESQNAKLEKLQNDKPYYKQWQVAKRLWQEDDLQGGRARMKAEVPFDPSTKAFYPSKTQGSKRATRYWGNLPGHRRPDVVITKDGHPPALENIETVVEMKFKGDPSDSKEAKERLRAYEDMFGEDNLVLLEEGKTCICDEDGDKDKVKETVADTVPEKDSNVNLLMLGGAAVLGIATIAAAIFPFDGPLGEAALGTATVATWSAAFAN